MASGINSGQLIKCYSIDCSKIDSYQLLKEMNLGLFKLIAQRWILIYTAQHETAYWIGI